MSDYLSMTFKELRVECKSRGLKAGGNRDALIDRLVEDDLRDSADDDAPVDRAGRPLVPDATDPDPDNPNFDLAGRWRRRPDHFIEWNPEDGYRTAIVKGGDQ